MLVELILWIKYELNHKDIEIIRTSAFHRDDDFFIIPTIGINIRCSGNFKCVEICFAWIGIEYYAYYEIKEF